MKQIIYIIALLVLTTSCDDWLDIKPKGKVIPKEINHFRQMLDQIDFTSKSSGVVRSFDIDLLLTDNVTIPAGKGNTAGVAGIRQYTWDKHFFELDGEDVTWKTVYNQIYTLNFIIDGLSNAEGDENEKQVLEAEAKVHRAFAYFTLVNLYGKHYNENTAAADLAVPLLIKPTLTGSLERASVKEVYELILSDLNLAYMVLPDVGTKTYLPSKAAVLALRSRVHLFKGEYDKALTDADACLDLSSFLYDYNSFSESLSVSGVLDFPKHYDNKEQILFKEANNGSFIYPSQDLLDLFDKDSDIRFTGAFSFDNGDSNNPYIYGLGILLQGRTCGLSVPEMLLTRAECYARAGETAKAMGDINTLRIKRIKTDAYTPLIAGSATEALELVKKERRIELVFKGLRWFDLKRYNQNDNALISLTHNLDGETYTLESTSPRWLLPIARKYIEMNPEIIQNLR